MLAQDVEGGVELLFADGGSTDRTIDVLREMVSADPRIRFLDYPPLNTPSALNACLRHARGEYVARMDAHSFFLPDYLRRGIERLGRGDTRWVSGPQIPQPNGRVSCAVAEVLASPLGRGGSRRWAERGAGGEMELDTGVFCGVWRRETLLEYGGWDERFGRNQDAEMAARFLANGERLVSLASMGAHYIPRNTLRKLWRQYYQWGFHRVANARQHPESLRRSHLLPAALALTCASSLVAPRPIRRLGRLGVGAYGATVALEAVRVYRRTGSAADAATVASVLPTMHLANGAGLLQGVAQFGFPLSSMAHIVGLDGLAARLAPPPEPVRAPHLAGE